MQRPLRPLCTPRCYEFARANLPKVMLPATSLAGREAAKLNMPQAALPKHPKLSFESSVRPLGRYYFEFMLVVLHS